MSSKKKHVPSPLVVSTGCSKFKSYLSLRRPLAPPEPIILPPMPSTTFSQKLPCSSQNIPQQKPNSNPSSAPLPPTHFRDGRSAAEGYWRRAKQLELELIQLDQWLSTERKLTDCLNNTTVTRESHKNLLEMEMIRLADGSYLHGIKKVGRPWGRLVIQVSAPAIADNGSSATEVLQGMASMGVKDLRKSLLESMPMGDLQGRRRAESEGKPISLGSESGFMEAIVLATMEKMEGLVLEGLKIQMGSRGTTTEVVKKKKEERSAECVVLVMLIQLRDPKEDYEAVGELMIGLVEASPPDVVGGKFRIEGVHVAGINCMNKQIGGKEFMWSASVKGCKGSQDSCYWKYVRNPNMVFAHKS